MITSEFQLLETISSSSVPDSVRKWLIAPTGASYHNEKRNRYSNILPNEETRVKLNPPIDGSDYINANFIWNNSYIATQNPLPNGGETIFWEMVLQQKVETIIMLLPTTNEIYWKPINEELIAPSGTVTLREESWVHKDKIIRRIFDIKNNNKNYLLTHYQYNGWPDFGVPSSVEDILILLGYLNSQKIKGTKVPKLIHCSAGVGRTGTLIIIDLLFRSKHRDPCWLTYQIRRERTGMVQSLLQYEFIYKILTYIKKVDQPHKKILNYSL